MNDEKDKDVFVLLNQIVARNFNGSLADNISALFSSSVSPPTVRFHSEKSVLCCPRPQGSSSTKESQSMPASNPASLFHCSCGYDFHFRIHVDLKDFFAKSELYDRLRVCLSGEEKR